MPRDASGVYTLPAGNPVVSGTVISSTWANDTMTDLKTEMQDSLSRSGNGGMLAALKGIDGVVGGPAYSFTSEGTSGWYRAAAGDLRCAVLGVDVIRLNSGVLQVWDVTDSAWYTVINAETAKRKNLVIGGDFHTNPWQRGTSFTSVSAATYTADRFIYGKDGAVVHDVSKLADAPTVAQAGMYTENSILLDVTTADASIAAGDFSHIITRLEGYDWARIAQRTFTLSFWHKHTKTGTYCVSFRNDGPASVPDRSYVAEYTQSVSDTWERATITVSASPVAGTWAYTTGRGLDIGFTVAAGTTWHTTADAWNTGDFLATANQVNGSDSTANNFRLALIQIEEGGVDSAFELRSITEELALCQRYFYKTFPPGTPPAQNAGNSGVRVSNASSNGRFALSADLPVQMRAVPSITTYNPGAANSDARNLTDGTDTPATPLIFDDSVVAIQPTALDATDASDMMAIHFTADAEL